MQSKESEADKSSRQPQGKDRSQWHFDPEIHPQLKLRQKIRHQAENAEGEKKHQPDGNEIDEQMRRFIERLQRVGNRFEQTAGDQCRNKEIDQVDEDVP